MMHSDYIFLGAVTILVGNLLMYDIEEMKLKCYRAHHFISYFKYVHFQKKNILASVNQKPGNYGRNNYKFAVINIYDNIFSILLKLLWDTDKCVQIVTL